MKRLAICGWDERSAALLRAISLRTDLRAVAIGDDRPAALVRARSATGLPCYQHVREMLNAVDCDAVMIGDVADREALLAIAAERRIKVLLRGDAADARTLSAASDTVSAGSPGLNVLRPELQHAGIDLIENLTTGDADWAPDLLQVELSDAVGIEAALSTAVALVARLQPEAASQVAVSALRGPTDFAMTANAQIRHNERALSIVTVQDHRDRRWRIALQAPAGLAELEIRGVGSTLTIEPEGGTAERSELVDDDLLDLEAARVASAASRRTDERHAPYESALLAAIESSLNTGFVVPVRDPGARGNLRVLEGGDLTTSRREGHLRILGT
jgi:hypothetical protein